MKSKSFLGKMFSPNKLDCSTGRPVDAAFKFREIFEGGTKKNIKAFLTRFDRFCEYQGFGNDWKCGHFCFVLDGDAFEAYDSLSEEIKNNYCALRATMLTIFGPAKLPPGKQYNGLFEIKMNESETVQEHYNNISRRIQHLKEVPEDLKLEIFKSGLPRYIKTHLKFTKPKTVMEALESARSAEALGDETSEEIEEIKRSQKVLNELMALQVDDSSGQGTPLF